MKESSATDNNNNSLIVEDEERATSSGVETIIATEESSSFNATADADDHAADDRAAAPKRKTTNKFYIIGGSLSFAAGVFGIASFAGSNIHSSKQQVAALMNDEVDGYEFVANGVCKDGNGDGNIYDYIQFNGITTPQACGERCSDCPGNNKAGLEFRGFSYWEIIKSCFCLVDDGADEDTLRGACKLGEDDGAYAGYSGSGEIQGTDGVTFAVCYKRLGRKSKSLKRGKANNIEAGGM